MKRTFMQIWIFPLILGILNLLGMIFALVGDGVADILSWVLLTIPVGIATFYLSRPGSKG